ncbi:MAG: DegT/DnrJ/EryC1/StrS family aminotransferase [Acidobacteria bacterium ACB1]|nr:DegT/DnrJ/EryC1/StrS family aminotransferase [Acidobacteria bacterium ACB1]
MEFTQTAEIGRTIEAELSANERIAPDVRVPFFRPDIGDDEVMEVMATLRSGWLTTGPKVKAFEQSFARAVRGKFAVAVNSCTAALHLAVEAIGLKEGDAVLIPTMTFAATAEIVLYKKAVPVLVDCDPVTGNMDLADAERKIEKIRQRTLPYLRGRELKPVGVIPVHVGGLMMDIGAIKAFASKHNLWVIEDAAHAFPSAWRPNSESRWEMCGENTASVTCFSFYANKTITTGEGGMAVTNSEALANKIRLMSLHGLSHDAWGRYTSEGSWDYKIVQPGYKYNLTDVAAAIGCQQLERAEQMREKREAVAEYYYSSMANIREISLPPNDPDRLHSWHLFPIRLKLDELSIDRNEFIEELKRNRVGFSVHWRPLHLHPLYAERFGWIDAHFPAASKLWTEIISLPLYSGMTREEMAHVVQTVKKICAAYSKVQISVAA